MSAAVPVFNPGQKSEGVMDYRNHDFAPEMRERDELRTFGKFLKIFGLCILGALALIAGYHYWPAISDFLNLSHAARL